MDTVYRNPPLAPGQREDLLVDVAVDVLAARVGRIVGALTAIGAVAAVAVLMALDPRSIPVPPPPGVFLLIFAEPARLLFAWLARRLTRHVAARRLAAATGDEAERRERAVVAPARRLVLWSVALGLAGSTLWPLVGISVFVLPALLFAPAIFFALLFGALIQVGVGYGLATLLAAPLIARAWQRGQRTWPIWALVAGLGTLGAQLLIGEGSIFVTLVIGGHAVLVVTARERFIAEEARLGRML